VVISGSAAVPILMISNKQCLDRCTDATQRRRSYQQQVGQARRGAGMIGEMQARWCDSGTVGDCTGEPQRDRRVNVHPIGPPSSLSRSILRPPNFDTLGSLYALFSRHAEDGPRAVVSARSTTINFLRNHSTFVHLQIRTDSWLVLEIHIDQLTDGGH
jgi:hypothetical protein